MLVSVIIMEACMLLRHYECTTNKMARHPPATTDSSRAMKFTNYIASPNKKRDLSIDWGLETRPQDPDLTQAATNHRRTGHLLQ